MSVPPRRHRLPQRLDWALIPPPLDLSQPLVDEKASLPAIIVTPSSPTGDRDFRIAFLASEAQPKEETFAERVLSRLQRSTESVAPKSQLKPRTLLLLFIPIFIVFCHLLAHRFSVHRPHLHFDVHTPSSVIGTSDGASDHHGAGWFDLNDFWDPRHARDFTVKDKGKPSHPSL